MILETTSRYWLEASLSVRYVGPFVVFVLFLALFPQLPMPAQWEAPLRVLLLAIVCVVCWPPELSARSSNPGASIMVGTAVFILWIAPDILIPGYRDSWLFSNSLIGHTHSSLPSGASHSPGVLFWRTVRAVIIVPVVEELFWRAWLMRWLINTDFWKVPLGTYRPLAFLLTAALFASEHGPYWDVGIITGLVYNWWMVRTKSIGNCILMHAVTNGLLSVYVVWMGQWQYWQ
ncbi:MAG TPA: CAAX prenyl protease-related protein [Bryobacteraceae bacterium]|nr:CAAX prenyl protease-related protein [Bryobacteraceae bacterium]